MRKMLVVIDYQYDFVSGTLGFPGAEKLDPYIAAKIREYVKNGDLVVETRDTHKQYYMGTREGKHLPVFHCIEETDGWEAYGETGKVLNGLKEKESIQYRQIRKETFSCHPYAMVDMLDWIVMNGIALNEIDEIEFVGLVSNICVISNICVFQGAFPNAQILVDQNLIASFDQKAHDAVLEVMKGLQVMFVGEEK